MLEQHAMTLLLAEREIRDELFVFRFVNPTTSALLLAHTPLDLCFSRTRPLLANERYSNIEQGWKMFTVDFYLTFALGFLRCAFSQSVAAASKHRPKASSQTRATARRTNRLD
jgi:hypothetical protein